MSRVFPDLKNPTYATQTLVVCQAKQEHRTITLSVIVLVPSCLFLVEKDVEGLRAGQILSRNLELTRESGLDPDVVEQQIFVVFNSLFDASRAFGRIDPRYRTREIPELRSWETDADWMMRQSWTIDQVGPDEEAKFVARADERAARHLKDRNKGKVLARDRTAQAGSIEDKTGRRNSGRIPLLCGSVERGLQKRTQAVRGIGRRMDWRAVVVQHYLDQLRSECFAIRRAAQSALLTKKIFEPGSRSAPEMRKLAERMTSYAQTLKTLCARPFTRRFTHVARELEEASKLLVESASMRNGASADLAKTQLEITYRSMCLFEEHWRIEEMLATASHCLHDKQSLTQHQVTVMHSEQEQILDRLTHPEPVTGSLIHEGFKRPDTVEDAVLHLRSCIEDLKTVPLDLKQFVAHLKAVCKPL